MSLIGHAEMIALKGIQRRAERGSRRSWSRSDGLQLDARFGGWQWRACHVVAEIASLVPLLALDGVLWPLSFAVRRGLPSPSFSDTHLPLSRVSSVGRSLCWRQCSCRPRSFRGAFSLDFDHGVHPRARSN